MTYKENDEINRLFDVLKDCKIVNKSRQNQTDLNAIDNAKKTSERLQRYFN
jgi:hypothetical protein